MEVRVLLPQPFFGSQALTVKPPALTRQNSEHYRGVPPVFARREAAAEDCRAIARVQRATAGSRPMTRATTRQAILARWRSSQRSSLIRRRPRVRIPLEPPFFSKRGRAANAARCKRDALTGYEGASPSASTILHPTRRKRRTVLVRQTAGRTSLWMLQFFADVAKQYTRRSENPVSASS